MKINQDKSVISWLDYTDKYKIESEEIQYRGKVILKKQHPTTTNLHIILKSHAIIIPAQIKSQSDLYPPEIIYFPGLKWLNIVTQKKELEPKQKSLRLLEKIRELNPQIPIIILSREYKIAQEEYYSNGATQIFSWESKGKKRELDEIVFDEIKKYKQTLHI